MFGIVSDWLPVIARQRWNFCSRKTKQNKTNFQSKSSILLTDLSHCWVNSVDRRNIRIFVEKVQKWQATFALFTPVWRMIISLHYSVAYLVYWKTLVQPRLIAFIINFFYFSLKTSSLKEGQKGQNYSKSYLGEGNLLIKSNF